MRLVAERRFVAVCRAARPLTPANDGRRSLAQPRRCGPSAGGKAPQDRGAGNDCEPYLSRRRDQGGILPSPRTLSDRVIARGSCRRRLCGCSPGRAGDPPDSGGGGRQACAAGFQDYEAPRPLRRSGAWCLIRNACCADLPRARTVGDRAFRGARLHQILLADRRPEPVVLGDELLDELVQAGREDALDIGAAELRPQVAG